MSIVIWLAKPLLNGIGMPDFFSFREYDSKLKILVICILEYVANNLDLGVSGGDSICDIELQCIRFGNWNKWLVFIVEFHGINIHKFVTQLVVDDVFFRVPLHYSF